MGFLLFICVSIYGRLDAIHPKVVLLLAPNVPCLPLGTNFFALWALSSNTNLNPAPENNYRAILIDHNVLEQPTP